MRLGWRTEECLLLLYWTLDTYGFPTWRKFNSSFEAWAYGNGFWDQLRRLEKARLLESQGESGLGRIYRLTESGRQAAVGGRDPVAEWARKWDGTWRLVLFDVPIAHAVTRNRLRNWLRQRAFGCLQGSVWISPDPLTLGPRPSGRVPVEATSLLVLEGRPSLGERDLDLVLGAWDFTRINEAYHQCEDHWRSRPPLCASPNAWTDVHRMWLRREGALWRTAVDLDPLLPRALHPPDYLGPAAWNERGEALSEFLRGGTSVFGIR